MEADEISCYASLIILIIIAILYLITYRKRIAGDIKHIIFKRELPHHELQKRKCPGCGSDDITFVKKGTVKCEKCGVLFGGTK